MDLFVPLILCRSLQLWDSGMNQWTAFTDNYLNLRLHSGEQDSIQWKKDRGS
jgi:hypothetical protein